MSTLVLRRVGFLIALAGPTGCWPAPAEVGDTESTSVGAAPSCAEPTSGETGEDDCKAFGDAACAAHGDCASGHCDDGRCRYLRSCRELQTRSNAGDGVYWVDFDDAEPLEPNRVLCDQSTDGGGWMLILKVHRAVHDGVSEGREAVRDGFNPQLLLDVETTVDRGLASHGTLATQNALSEDPWARFTLVAGADPKQTATWFKQVASAESFSQWFFHDSEPSPICLASELLPNCSMDVIATDVSATRLGGMTLRDHGFTADGDLQLRLAGEELGLFDADFELSGVASQTYNYDGNAWYDAHGSGEHWGNGLLVWLR